MLFEDLKKAQMDALKEKNTLKRSILQIVTGKAMLVKIAKREKNEELTDQDVLQVIAKVIKELEEEKLGFEKAGRTEKVEELASQQKLLEEYLPRQLTEEEIKTEIEKLEDKSMPNIMKHFKINFAGKCDMKLVNQIANQYK